MTGALILLAFGIQAATCAPAGGWPLEDFTREACPQVYRIQGSAELDRALNIVVLPDGFTAEELDDFRCAAGLMMEKLTAIDPFHEFSESINVFRIDLISATSGADYPERCGTKACPRTRPAWPNQDCQCRALAERAALPLPLRGLPAYPPDHPECLQLELDVKGCPSEAPECQVLWPAGEGLRRLWRVASCAPAHDLVIVLVNSGDWAGGGTEDLYPPLAVATLMQIGEWTHRSRLLSHEVGHTLGLLDEYPGSVAFTGEGHPKPNFHQGRNIVYAEPGSLPTDVPWKSLCSQGVAGLTRYAAGECFTVCNQGCDLPRLDDQPWVGLFEGGFYESAGYFRPSQDCKMQDLEDDFCDACAYYIENLLTEMGLQRNANGPRSRDDPNPECPLAP